MGGICWIASYPKSGNTWLRIFLRNLLYEIDDVEDIDYLQLIEFQDVQPQWYQQAAGRNLEGMSPEEIFKLTPKAQEIISQQIPDTVFVKTHNLLGVQRWNTPNINMNVTAGAICIVRNPLDVTISLKHHFGLPDIDTAIEFLNKEWNEVKGKGRVVATMFGSWRQQVESWTKMHPQYRLQLRYEDMLHKPLETFGKVNIFLGANKSEDVLKRAIELSSFDKLKSMEKEKGYSDKSKKAESFFRAGTSGQWEEILTKKQIKKIVDANYDLMKKYGYLPKGYD